MVEPAPVVMIPTVVARRALEIRDRTIHRARSALIAVVTPIIRVAAIPAIPLRKRPRHEAGRHDKSVESRANHHQVPPSRWTRGSPGQVQRGPLSSVSHPERAGYLLLTLVATNSIGGCVSILLSVFSVTCI